MSTYTFPNNFIFGGATAAYQCEGESRTHGKGKVAWDDYLEEQGLYSPDPASDFYNRYPIDLKLCNEFGINGIRVSIAWSRIFPDGIGEINEEGVQFYHDLFAECKRQGVEPFVTLHHFDTPNTLYQNGDFLNRAVIDAFENYARFAFEEYPEVKYWFTFNEIWAASSNTYIENTWPCGESFRVDHCFQAMHNKMVAHARAINIFDEMGHPGVIGIVHSLEPAYPFDQDSAADQIAAKRSDILANQFLLDATYKGYYSEETLEIMNDILDIAGGEVVFLESDMEDLRKAAPSCDCLGINYYQSRFIRSYDGPSMCHHNSTGDKGTERYCLSGLGERMMPVDIPRTDWDWLIYPEGLYDLIMRIKKQYPNYGTIYITENGMGEKDVLVDGHVHDVNRIDYVKQHFKWIIRAIDDGAKVDGYFIWSLQDMFSWTNGYNKRYGLFYVDFDTQERIPKDSAYWYKKISDTKELEI